MESASFDPDCIRPTAEVRGLCCNTDTLDKACAQTEDERTKTQLEALEIAIAIALLWPS